MSHRGLQKWLLLHYCKSAYVVLVVISIIIVIACQRSAVLLPSNISNQLTELLKGEGSQLMGDSKHLKLPRPAESNQFKRESETAWVKVGPDMFVFSAYLDIRKHYYYRKRAVVALAVQNDRMNHPFLYCHLTDSNGRTWCLKHHISKILLNKDKQYKYRPYYYICNLPPRFSAITPKFVSFSFNSSCQQPSPPV